MLTCPMVDCPVRKKTETSAKVPVPREREHIIVPPFALQAKTDFMKIVPA